MQVSVIQDTVLYTLTSATGMVFFSTSVDFYIAETNILFHIISNYIIFYVSTVTFLQKSEQVSKFGNKTCLWNTMTQVEPYRS